jgi:ribose 5-phosphate isomerase B
MTPPKRALFSLNLDSDADHVYQRVSDHSKEGTDRVKVLETKGPTHGHTDLTYVTRPFEKTVNRVVNDVITGSGKKVHSAEGELTYSTESSSSRTGNSRLNVKNKSRRRALEEKYDTSEL